MTINWGPGADDYFGLTLIHTWVVGAGATTTPTQRGTIDFDQIRSTARHGTGTQFQMVSGTPSSAGQIAVFDAAGNIVPETATNSAAVTPILDSSGNPIFDSNGDWIFPG